MSWSLGRFFLLVLVLVVSDWFLVSLQILRKASEGSARSRARGLRKRLVGLHRLIKCCESSENTLSHTHTLVEYFDALKKADERYIKKQQQL